MGKLLHEEQFKHVDYHHTNLRKTFARIRAQQKEAAKAQAESEADKVARLYVLYPNLPRANG
jgi:hypothetical protein